LRREQRRILLCSIRPTSCGGTDHATVRSLRPQRPGIPLPRKRDLGSSESVVSPDSSSHHEQALLRAFHPWGVQRGEVSSASSQSRDPRLQEGAGTRPCRGFGGVPQISFSLPQDWGPRGLMAGNVPVWWGCLGWVGPISCASLSQRPAIIS